MIKEIVTDKNALSEKCLPCFFDPMEETRNKIIINDLFDTANSHSNCVGLASNQIGYKKRICVVKVGGEFIAMVNPVIMPIKTAGVKAWKETCLSLPNQRIRKRRFKKVKVTFQLVTGLKQKLDFRGIEAAIVQHEVDHLNGKTI